MYYYIFDIFTSQKKHEKQLQKIEGLITELGINGKIYKLNVLKNLEDIIEEAIDNGIKNIVAVGNDQTVSKVANLLINKKIVMGIIPLGEPNVLAGALGINSYTEACKIISARKVAKLDVGKVNGQYFLLSVESNDKNIIFDFKNYNINPLNNNRIMGVYNINIDQLDYKSNPCDGLMEVIFAPNENSWWQKLTQKNQGAEQTGISIFPTKKLILKHKKKPIQINIDRQRVLKTPLEIEVLPKNLSVIVGRDRIFN